jgi:hypothetical protein
MGNRAFNLLSKDDCRLALANEMEEDGPQVSFVAFASLFSGL